MRARRLAALATLASAAAGCGGPSDAEQRAAADRWATSAGRACQRAEGAIRERGAPLDAVDIDRLAARGLADAERAVGEIERLKVPEGAGGRVKPAVERVKRLRPHLRKLGETSELRAYEGLAAAVERAGRDLAAADAALRRAGVRDCLSSRDRSGVADALLAPIFLQQFRGLVGTLQDEVSDLGGEETLDGKKELEEYYDALLELVVDARDRLDRLVVPARAEQETKRYASVLFDVENRCKRTAEQLFALKRITPEYARGAARAFAALDRRERRARLEVVAAVRRGAGSKPEPEPSAEPA